MIAKAGETRGSRTALLLMKDKELSENSKALIIFCVEIEFFKLKKLVYSMFLFLDLLIIIHYDKKRVNLKIKKIKSTQLFWKLLICRVKDSVKLIGNFTSVHKNNISDNISFNQT